MALKRKTKLISKTLACNMVPLRELLSQLQEYTKCSFADEAKVHMEYDWLDAKLKLKWPVPTETDEQYKLRCEQHEAKKAAKAKLKKLKAKKSKKGGKYAKV